ncbi:MAG TPA: hypothetical protein VFU22_33480 [Roseiflexaceae bacterium]|nr:hypothetical protein [Roseiflexaceae bacterium]
MGQAHRAATLVVERLAHEGPPPPWWCVCTTPAPRCIEAHGPRHVREAIAEGRHLTTLAFSETGSRSHFWAPVSTAIASNGHVQLDAQKSWATSAGQVDSYVWSSRPLAADGASTIWLVPADASGLRIPAPFNGWSFRARPCLAPMAVDPT